MKISIFVSFFLLQTLFLTYMAYSSEPLAYQSKQDSLSYSNLVDSLNHSLKRQQNVINAKFDEINKEKLKTEIDFANKQIEMANRIIDYSAMIFTVLAILLVIAGGIGLREFSQIRKIERNMQEAVAQIHLELENVKKIESDLIGKLKETEKELSKIESYKDDILDETKKYMEITYYLNEGIQRYHTGDTLKARELLYRVISLDRDNTKAYFIIGKSLIVEDMNDDALNIFEKILKIDPDNADAYYGLAINNFEINKNKAISYCKKAVELNPNHPFAINYLGLLYRDIDKIEETLEYHLKSRSVRKIAGTAFFIGIIYFAKGDFENAKKLFDESNYLAHEQIEKAIQVHWPYYTLGVIEGLNGNLSESKKFILKAIEANKTHNVRRAMKSHLDFLLRYKDDKRDIENINTMVSFLKNEI